MSNTEHGTGHPHTNDTRKQFNNKVEKLAILGKTKKVAWDNKRIIINRLWPQLNH